MSDHIWVHKENISLHRTLYICSKCNTLNEICKLTNTSIYPNIDIVGKWEYYVQDCDEIIIKNILE